MKDYLSETEAVDYKDTGIQKLADQLEAISEDKTDYVKRAYEYVRDHISHSADIGAMEVTCSASEVLRTGHGFCFAKSNLLAALLRAKGIPAGFCYQKLILDDETAPYLTYHGLNGVYLEELNRWIRLDARGNKEGVRAAFSTGREKLAFAVRKDHGEIDDFIIYPNPDANVMKALQENTTREQLWDNLPDSLTYNKDI